MARLAHGPNRRTTTGLAATGPAARSRPSRIPPPGRTPAPRVARPAQKRESLVRGVWAGLVLWSSLCAAGGALVALAPLPAPGADWPQFQGPGASGISPETGLARSWPEGGPPALWTLQVGTGFGGAAVQGGEVYLLDRLGDTQDALRCLDLATGRELWRFAYDAPGELPHPGSRQVPSVADRLVYTVGPFGHVQAVDRRTHRSAWSRHLLNDFGGGKVPEWGFAQCPLVYGDTVIVAPRRPRSALRPWTHPRGPSGGHRRRLARMISATSRPPG
jgi:hypothetical protein